MASKTINTTVTADGNTLVPDWNGRLGAFLAAGTFDGATVKLQQKIGSTWVDLGSDTTLTADGGGQFITPQSELRVNTSSAGAGTSITIIVKPLMV
jgi:hypothetical protein